MSYNMLQKLILFISAISMSACASIPHATVELSTLLGKQIDALEQSHVATINAYYAEKERTIIDFIDKTWYPQYLERLFAEPTTIEYWNEVLSEELPQQIESLKEFTAMIQEDYSEEKEMLLTPLQDDKKELLAIVQEHYALAREMNNTITNNVNSAHALQEKQKQILSTVLDTDGIEQQVDLYFQKADSILNKAQTALTTIENKLNK